MKQTASSRPLSRLADVGARCRLALGMLQPQGSLNIGSIVEAECEPGDSEFVEATIKAIDVGTGQLTLQLAPSGSQAFEPSPRTMTNLYSISSSALTTRSSGSQRQMGKLCSSVVNRSPRSGRQLPNCSVLPAMTIVSPKSVFSHRTSKLHLTKRRPV